MNFQIEHEISWHYDRPVFIEPMTIRLRPRSDGSLHLQNWQLIIDPLPSGQCDALDALGNAVCFAWFHEPHENLQIRATSSVKTWRVNPFDYLLIDNNVQRLPMRYEPSLANWLQPYQTRQSVDLRIDQWATNLASASGLALPYLSALASAMFTDFERTTREEGAAFSPDATFEARRGSCRDLAVVFIDACRSQGIASRFVSGYAFEQDREGSSDLHAWVEVYLPGAGWRGYDPTLGIAVADQHIPVAAAPEPLAAAPTCGTFRGTEAKSTIGFQVKIQALSEL